MGETPSSRSSSTTVESGFNAAEVVGCCNDERGRAISMSLAYSAGQKVLRTSFRRGSWMGFETKSSMPASWQCCLLISLHTEDHGRNNMYLDVGVIRVRG
jgi:hypothetical protein